MTREILYFLVFLYAIAKVLAMTGLGVGLAAAFLAELREIRVVAIGVERVSGVRQLAKPSERAIPTFARSATSRTRKVAAHG